MFLCPGKPIDTVTSLFQGGADSRKCLVVDNPSSKIDAKSQFVPVDEGTGIRIDGGARRRPCEFPVLFADVHCSTHVVPFVKLVRHDSG